VIILEINTLLLKLGVSGVSMRYFREILTICLECGYVPMGVYSMAAKRITPPATSEAVGKAVSLHAKGMWEQGLKLGLWVEDGPYVSGRHLLDEMLVLLSRG